MKDFLQLQDKHIVIMGVANDRSIAWSVAQSLHAAGAKLIFTYRQERSAKKLNKLLEKNEMDAAVIQCDVNDDASITSAFAEIKEKFTTVHGLVHSVAHAHKEDLNGDFIDTSRDGYAFAQDTSAYSLVAVAKAVRPLMAEGGSIVTMSYLGADRVLDGYNVMGVAKAALEASVRYLANDLGPDNIRINAISAGPIRTLAAKGVPSFNEILSKVEEKAPLRRNVSAEEVGDMTTGLMGALSRGVTGEVIYVDAGFNIIGIG
ncbi:enoyl-ACP reductase FabI [Terribacillus sp. DMT04]|uniref:enoyl-ACP reductase FabI n=1 Tax=Terribacillus sp. DMT04 TaxID=2850441 RepID=UPI001C2C7FC7|nr:enoyl-ACP reductase FabI [Terribacillus sp. DMT04]QXE02063.1 enoyl-ACP reductase FabI [Terribacillus sp. DMT04]